MKVPTPFVLLTAFSKHKRYKRLILKLQSDLNVLQCVDLITPPIAGIRLNFQSDHTSWRNDSVQENIVKRIRAFYIHESVVFKWIFWHLDGVNIKKILEV